MKLPLRFRLAFVWSLLPFLSLSNAQTVPSGDQWGEKFNSAGAKLTYKEVARTKLQGKTVITYNLFASGLPKDKNYVLCILNVGSDPRAVADAYLNTDGEVVSALADPAHHIAEDPINARVFGGKGEPIRFALVSDDDQLRAFAEKTLWQGSIRSYCQILQNRNRVSLG